MARYVAELRSPMSPDEAFVFMADLTNFERWDPGVERAVQVTGQGPGPEAEFDVTVGAVRGSLTMRYRTIEYAAPSHVVVRAETKMLTSLDAISVRADGAGSVITYDAQLHLNGPLRIFDVVLGPVFKRIAERAATGLIEVVHGERLPGES